MRFDLVLHVGGRRLAFARLGSGEQAVDRDAGLLGQGQRLRQRVGRVAGHHVVGGEHDRGRALAGRVLLIRGAVGESRQHRRAADHAVADQRGGVRAVLRALEPGGDPLVLRVAHLVDVVLRLHALERLRRGRELVGDQRVVVGKREHRARRGVEDAQPDALALEIGDEAQIGVQHLAVIGQGRAGHVEAQDDVPVAGALLALIDERGAGDQHERERHGGGQ